MYILYCILHFFIFICARCRTGEGKSEHDPARERCALNSLFTQCCDQYWAKVLNICHQTITHWWNKSMDDRGDRGRAVCLLTQLLRDGEGKEIAKTESETSGVWRGLRFFSWGQSVLFSSLSLSLFSYLWIRTQQRRARKGGSLTLGRLHMCFVLLCVFLH